MNRDKATEEKKSFFIIFEKNYNIPFPVMAASEILDIIKNNKQAELRLIRTGIYEEDGVKKEKLTISLEIPKHD